MTTIATNAMRITLLRLKSLIQAHDDSLRSLCARTKRLDQPERMHHTTLSSILHGKQNRNLYLQQFLVLLKLLGSSPERFFLGDDAGALAEAMAALPKADRSEIMKIAAAKLEARGKRVIAKRLRHHAT